MAVTITHISVSQGKTEHEPGHQETPVIEALNVVLDATTGNITLADECKTIKHAVSVALGAKNAAAASCYYSLQSGGTVVRVHGAIADDVDVWIFGTAV